MENKVTEVTIDNKKYVILPKEKYEKLTKEQVYKKYEGDLLTHEEAKVRAYTRIDKWAKSS